MPNVRGAVRGAASGAAMASYIPIPGASAVGAVVGGIAGLFGDSEEEQRQARKAEALRAIAKARAETMARVGAQVQGGEARARAAAARRAAAGGLSGSSVQALELPGVASAQNVGARTMSDMNTYYDNAAMQVETDFANRPMEPSLMETVGAAADAYGAFTQNQALTDWIKGQTPPSPATPVVPPEPAGSVTQGISADVGNAMNMNNMVSDYIASQEINPTMTGVTSESQPWIGRLADSGRSVYFDEAFKDYPNFALSQPRDSMFSNFESNLPLTNERVGFQSTGVGEGGQQVVSVFDYRTSPNSLDRVADDKYRALKRRYSHLLPAQ